MKNYLLIGCFVLLSGLVLGKSFSESVAASQNVTGQKWEYQVARSSVKDLRQPEGPNTGFDSFNHWVVDPSGLSGWGEQGWELISVVKEYEGQTPFLFYFKRPKK
jgi:hypothetical protein